MIYLTLFTYSILLKLKTIINVNKNIKNGKFEFFLNSKSYFILKKNI